MFQPSDQTRSSHRSWRTGWLDLPETRWSDLTSVSMQGKWTLGFIHPFQLGDWILLWIFFLLFLKLLETAPVTTNYGALWLPSALVGCSSKWTFCPPCVRSRRKVMLQRRRKSSSGKKRNLKEARLSLRVESYPIESLWIGGKTCLQLTSNHSHRTQTSSDQD